MLFGKNEEIKMSNNRSEALWQNYDIYTTKEKIIESAKRDHGGFVCTDGAWCMTRTPKEFKEMLEYFFGFQIEKCEEKEGCSALATTKDGYIIAWNGYCRNTHNTF